MSDEPEAVVKKIWGEVKGEEIIKWVKQGFIPYKKDIGSKEYIVLAKKVGRKSVQRSLGAFTEDKWKAITALREKYKSLKSLKLPGLKPEEVEHDEEDKRVRRVVEEVLEALGLKPEETGVVEEGERAVELPEYVVSRKISVSPATLLYYQYWLSKGGAGSLDDFINAVVEEHFTECLGVMIGVISRPAIIKRGEERG